MTPGKLISIIAVLILLTLAAEGGYYWGFGRGLKAAPVPLSVLTQTPVPTPGPIYSGKDPADIQTTVIAMTLLFKPQVINHLQDVPPQNIDGSSWYIEISGTLLELTDKNITLEFSTGITRSWNLLDKTPAAFKFYNKATQQTQPASLREFNLGDRVYLNIGFNTLTGEVKEVSVIKNIGVVVPSSP